MLEVDLQNPATLSDPKKREQIIEENNPFFYGVSLKNFNILSPMHGDVQGVLVVSIDPASNAWQSDLRPGDVIISANQQPVKNIDELKTVVAKIDHSLLLNVLRVPGAIFLVISKEA